jgi:hypothetical protein
LYSVSLQIAEAVACRGINMFVIMVKDSQTVLIVACDLMLLVA